MKPAQLDPVFALEAVMYVYIQWPGNQPLEKRSDEADARDAIAKKYPAANFGPRQKVNGTVPAFPVTTFDDAVVVFPDKTSKDPIAVIWFPVT
jgi:hypothetical protein